MSFETQVVVIALLWVGFFVYRSVQRSRFPVRLIELEQAIRDQADLAMHRNGDAMTGTRLHLIYEHLKYAQMLVNSPPATIARDWPRIHRSVREAIDPETFRRIGYFHADRIDPAKAAVIDLEARIQRKLGKKAANIQPADNTGGLSTQRQDDGRWIVTRNGKAAYIVTPEGGPIDGLVWFTEEGQARAFIAGYADAKGGRPRMPSSRELEAYGMGYESADELSS